ncbi:class I SAM-dependent methyltransferase [Luteimonas sp. A501]
MPAPDEPHFDGHADRYRELHRDSVRGSGEEPDYFAAYKIDWIAKALPAGDAATGLRILDFGCGIGTSIPHLQRNFTGARIIGVDVSGRSIAMAREAHPAVRFDMIEGERIPLPDASIDVAFAACVYHHLVPSERARWTAELHRVLRPGGRLFIFEHNPLNPLTRRVVRDCAFDDDAVLLPRRESLQLLRGAGFADAAVDYIVFFPAPLAFLRPLEPWLAIVPLGAQYVAHAVS